MSRSTARRVALAAAAATTAVAVTTGALGPAPVPVNSAKAVTAASQLRTVFAEVALRNVVVIYVPGTGGTSANPPETTDLSWLDGGAYNGLPVDGMTNSADYPAVLGSGVGQQSLDMGTDSLVKKIQGYNPKTTSIILVGGSQGSMVIYRALSQPGVSGYDIHAVLYSNPDTPGTGITARFPGQEVPSTGIKGGTPVQPTDIPIVSVSHSNDPMAYFPKYAWTYPLTLPIAVLGFLTAHPDLALIDYSHAEVTQSGNLTVVKLIDPLTPVAKLLVFAVNQVAGPQVAALVANLIKPADDIFAGIIKLGGQDEPGAVTLFPTPDVALKQVVTLAKSFQQAGQDLVSLLSGHPVISFGQTTGLTPTQQVVQEAHNDDAVLNGASASGSPSPTAALAPTPTVAPTTTTTPSEPTVAKSDVQVQSLALAPATATQPPASQSDKPVVDSKDKASDAPVSSPSVTPPATQPVVTNTTPSPAAEPQQNSQKEPASDVHKDAPKDEKDTPKVKAPTSDHPKGETDSASDVMKNGNAVQSRNAKKGDNDDQGSGPKSGGANSTAPHTAASNSSSTDSDSAGGSKASAGASGGESHSTS